MKILALETSTEFCSVALFLNGKIYTREILAERHHSEILLAMTQELLVNNKLNLSQIDGIAFGAGPGSFTGLRIACGVAQGLAYAMNLPVVGVSTLEAVAQRVGATKIIVALDARMGEIYHAAYHQLTSNTWKIISSPTLCLPQNAPLLTGENWLACGSGFDVYHQELSMRYCKRICTIRFGLHPNAREVAQLAISKFNDNYDTNPAHASPIYIRNKVALKENER